jgi:hypothetical protein
MANKFRNWHRPSAYRRAKEKPLSGIFPTQTWVNALTGDCSISFQDAYGQQITFYLDSGTRAQLRHNLGFPKQTQDGETQTIGSDFPVQ